MEHRGEHGHAPKLSDLCLGHDRAGRWGQGLEAFPSAPTLSSSQGCSGDEREMAKMVADTISRMEKQVVAEGQEPSNFWMALGGKAPYANSKR